MSRLYKRSDSPYWWYTRGTGSARIQTSTKCTSKSKAKLLQDKWDSLVFLEKHNFKVTRKSIFKMVDDYLAGLQIGTNESTFKRYRSSIQCFTAWLKESKHKDLKVHQFELDHGNEYVVYRIKQGKAPKTINEDVRMLILAWQYAQRRNYSRVNIWEDVDKPPKLIKNPRSALDLKIVKHVIENEENLKYKIFWSILSYTGMRVHDAMTLTKEDFIGDIIYFTPEKVAQYAIWTPCPLHKNLLKFKREDMYNIFSSKWFLDESRKKFQDLMRDYGSESKTIDYHSLRHSFASRLFEKGASVEDVRLLTGWTNTKTAEGYIHTQDQRLKNMIELSD